VTSAHPAGHALSPWLRGLAPVLVCGLVMVMAAASTLTGPPEPVLAPQLLVTGHHVGVEDVLAGRAGRFEPTGRTAVAIGGDPAATYWIRLDAVLAPAMLADNADNADDAEQMVVWTERVPVPLIRLHQPGTGLAPQSRDFFDPDAGEPLLFAGHVFPLARSGPASRAVLLELRSPIRQALAPELLEQAQYAAQDRLRALLFSAIYAGLLVLALLSFALWAALRDRTWLLLAAFTAATGFALLALNGHAYAMPGLRWLGWSGALGVMGVLCVLAATAVLLACEYSGLPRRRPRQWWAARVGVGLLLGLAIAGFAGPQAWAPWLQWVMLGSWIAALLACVACALQAWGDGEASGRPMLMVWSVLLGFTLTRVLVDQGWVEGNLLTVYGIQYALAGAVFLFGLAQADRMMEFRRLRDRARLDKARVDADLAVEQVRRHLIEDLHMGIRGADAKDVEWLAFRRLLEAVRSLVPQQGSSVIAFGYHGLDLLLAEPLGLKQEYTRLLARRGATIKGLCRSRKPVNLPLEEIVLPDGGVVPGGVFAVVPLQVARPGWGGLLVRREEGSAFEPFELQLLGEFAQVAVNAADEAAAAVDLRRRAELDPLTGALNRRAMDGRLQAIVERTHAERRPLALLFVDIDHFKQVNDHHGHGVGDDCLRLASDCIRRHLGKDDLFGRYGGEEFIIVLPDMRQDAARELADRIREAVAALRVVGEANVTFTVSIGLASRMPAEKSPRSIVERADKALYQAKRGGRNRVQVASSHGFGVEGAAAEFH